MSLQGASKFKSFAESLHIHMVECSPALQKLQQCNLKCMDEDNASESSEKRTISTLAGTPVSWHALLEQVPSGCMELSFKLLCLETLRMELICSSVLSSGFKFLLTLLGWYLILFFLTMKK